MLGLLIIIVISWVLLHFIEKKNLSVLGLIPTSKRSFQFLIGFVLIVLINLSSIYIETKLKSISWEYNGIDPSVISKALWYHFKSALTEDLVFRGAILYILISRVGANWAILASALCFGVYHVFSYGMTGDNLVPVVYVILVTGFTGYVWAYVYYKTESVLLGLGLHIGYNMLMTCFFPSQPYGELLFSELSRINFSGWNELYFSIFKGIYPSALTLAIFRLLLKSNFSIFKQCKS